MELIAKLRDLFRPKPSAHPNEVTTVAPQVAPISYEMALRVTRILAVAAAGLGHHKLKVMRAKDGRFIGEISGQVRATLKFSFGGGFVDIGHFTVKSDLRRRGLCRQFTQQLYLALKGTSFTKIQLIASSDGRYVWCVLGFRPTALSFPQLQYSAKQLLESGEAFGRPVQRQLERLVKANNTELLPILCNGSGSADDPLSPAGIGFRLLTSQSTWKGELLIGNLVCVSAWNIDPSGGVTGVQFWV